MSASLPARCPKTLVEDATAAGWPIDLPPFLFTEDRIFQLKALLTIRELLYPTSLRLITPWKPPNRQNEPAAK